MGAEKRVWCREGIAAARWCDGGIEGGVGGGKYWWMVVAERRWWMLDGDLRACKRCGGDDDNL